MPGLDLSKCFVAKENGNIVGVCGYKMLPDGRGKTTVLAVLPECRGQGIGYALQVRRVEEMESLGAKSVITNADRPESIAWYKKHFGYVEVGKLAKLHEFGRPDVPEWTTIEMSIPKWRKEHGA
jgi:ribosomal-protein-alanine N-acetyltransferase